MYFFALGNMLERCVIGWIVAYPCQLNVKRLGQIGRGMMSVKVLYGVLFNPYALWVGAHYSTYNRRLCINVLPMLTFWIVFKGGTVPKKKDKK
jgi:hypothetical protein